MSSICGFISSHANSPEKLTLLKQAANSLSSLNIPIYHITSHPVNLDNEYVVPNRLIRLADFLSLQEIKIHWRGTRYRLSWGNTNGSINYSLIGELYFNNYHWAALDKIKKSIFISQSLGYEWLLWSEGDVIWKNGDVPLPDLLSSVKSDGIYLAHRDWPNHMLGNHFVLRLNSQTAREITDLSLSDFINMFPHLTAEALLYEKFTQKCDVQYFTDKISLFGLGEEKVIQKEIGIDDSDIPVFGMGLIENKLVLVNKHNTSPVEICFIGSNGTIKVTLPPDGIIYKELSKVKYASQIIATWEHNNKILYHPIKISF